MALYTLSGWIFGGKKNTSLPTTNKMMMMHWLM
jgi:hypothetical protein